MDNKAHGFLIEAVATVRSWYPEDVFPDDVDGGETEGDRRSRASGKMARLTCDNILRVAQKIAVDEETE